VVNLSHGNRQAIGTVRWCRLTSSLEGCTELQSLVGQSSFGTSAIQVGGPPNFGSKSSVSALLWSADSGTP
jgi:hypothetical protein